MKPLAPAFIALVVALLHVEVSEDMGVRDVGESRRAYATSHTDREQRKANTCRR